MIQWVVYSLFGLSYLMWIIVAGYIAHMKGRDEIGWGIFAALSPVIAIPTIVMLKPLCEEYSENREKNDRVVKRAAALPGWFLLGAIVVAIVNYLIR